jgi:hypothetical protein
MFPWRPFLRRDLGSVGLSLLSSCTCGRAASLRIGHFGFLGHRRRATLVPLDAHANYIASSTS